MTTRVVSWNIAKRWEPWRQLVDMGADIALLQEAGASLSDVVRTRAFLTDISKAGDYGRAHGEVFGDIRPAATLVEVSALVHPDLVVEIEVDAIISSISSVRT